MEEEGIVKDGGEGVVAEQFVREILGRRRRIEVEGGDGSGSDGAWLRAAGRVGDRSADAILRAMIWMRRLLLLVGGKRWVVDLRK